LLLAACSSGPAFTNPPQSNAAILEGPVVPTQGAEDGNCSVVVEQVDGLSGDFTASHVGMNWPAFNGVKPLSLTPTKHQLSLKVSYTEKAGGGARGTTPQGPGDEGSNGGGEIKASSRAEIFAALEAGHAYRVTAEYEDEAISVVLWDETSGAAVRTRVEDWSFSCPRTNTERPAPNAQVMEMLR
jgi:hypothetical protein